MSNATNPPKRQQPFRACRLKHLPTAKQLEYRESVRAIRRPQKKPVQEIIEKPAALQQKPVRKTVKKPAAPPIVDRPATPPAHPLSNGVDRPMTPPTRALSSDGLLHWPRQPSAFSHNAPVHVPLFLSMAGSEFCSLLNANVRNLGRGRLDPFNRTEADILAEYVTTFLRKAEHTVRPYILAEINQIIGAFSPLSYSY
uniref:Uncharacterized protein n=1 Tax=Steinernema glaseri TaxID=37863 RepID=A0A1I8AD89_9BILA